MKRALLIIVLVGMVSPLVITRLVSFAYTNLHAAMEESLGVSDLMAINMIELARSDPFYRGIIPLIER